MVTDEWLTRHYARMSNLELSEAISGLQAGLGTRKGGPSERAELFRELGIAQQQWQLRRVSEKRPGVYYDAQGRELEHGDVS